MAEHASDDKKGCCGYGRCSSTAVVLVVLALMTIAGAIGYLMGKSCAMGGGMAACPVMGNASQETAPKK